MTNEPNEMTPNEYIKTNVQIAQDAASEASAALVEIRRLHDEMRSLASKSGPAVRPPKQGVPTSLPVGARGTAAAEEVRYQQRRDLDDNTKRACICGAPLYAHTPEPPYGCPDNDCPQFSLAR